MADVTGRVLEEGRGIEDRAVEMLEVIAAERCPDVAIGLHCDSFYGCPVESCRDFLPEDDVFQLYRGGRQCYDLLERGIFSLKDIPGDFKLDGRQRIQQQCALTGLPHVNPGEIRKFLGSLEYPLYYLDFETFSPAVPLFDGTRPYQGIPFQFSVHVVEKRKARPRHYSFLAEGRKDPRRELLVALERTLGDSGSIVVYNQSFESGVLSDLGGLFPEYHDRMGNMRGRIIDLLAPFRGFDYYHPLQKGSASIKDVLPALTGTSYEGLGINNGEIASSAFLEITFGDVPDEERRKVRADLEEYCKLDTLGMALIVDKLKELSAAPKKGATS
ncbi:MAG: DUF2779 domain-containing protein, partial [Dehalococcoidia bacterium]|nr:DUF2779 domain-containing protein [Dehalococcoidia bacterium]